MEEVFIVAAGRTPIGSFNGSLSTVSATRLGAVAIRAVVKNAGIAPEEVNELYMGNVLTANEGQAPARQAGLYAGLHPQTPCTTVNKVCASGLKAIMLGAQSILLGDNNVVVAGGMENMSQVPYYLDKARNGYRLGHGQVTDGIIQDGLWDPYHDFHMGNAAELCATKYKLSREQQDAYAMESYRRVAQAYERGHFQKEVIPVEIEGKTRMLVDEDEEYKRADFNKMPNLRPAFQEAGSITAANSSKINDGAAAVLLMSAAKVKELGAEPLARIVSFADAAQEPAWFSTTPAIAMKLALRKAGLSMEDMDYAEINEAFSCVALANQYELGLDEAQVNAWGGAVALGHPIGCSGARIIVTLTNLLKECQARYGIAGICNGGGGAGAMIIERM